MFDQRNIILLSTLLLLGIAFSTSSKAASNDDSKVLVEVNGKFITTATLQRYQRRRGIPKDTNPADQIKAMLEELINRELIFQDALTKGLDKDKKVKADIENQRVNIIAGAMLKKASEASKVTEKKIKAAYQQHIKKLNGLEYHARHILLEKEDEAKAVIKLLNAGGNFESLAGAKSTGPSKSKGGDLGWFSPQQMVKPFSDAVAKLKLKQYSKSPVKTQFGWHVIKLEESRKTPPPSFEDLKEQLRMRLQNKGVETYIAKLRKSAKIVKK